MKMLNVLLVGITLFIGISSVNAQEKAVKTPAERAAMHTERMTKMLDLTANQQAKVSEVNLGIAMKNDGVRNNANLTNEQKQEIIKSNREAHKTMLKSILTEEQMKKFEENEAERHMKMEARKGDMKKKKATKNTPVEEIEEL